MYGLCMLCTVYVWFIIRAIQELVYYGMDCFYQGENLLHDRYLHHDVNRDHFHEHLLALVLVEI